MLGTGSVVAACWPGSETDDWAANITRVDTALQLYDIRYADGTPLLGLPPSAIRKIGSGPGEVAVPSADPEHTRVCDVCYFGQVPGDVYRVKKDEEDPPLLSCELCGVSVHAFCYGLPRQLDEDDPRWFCQRCGGQEAWAVQGRRDLDATLAKVKPTKSKKERKEAEDAAQDEFTARFAKDNVKRMDCVLCPNSGFECGGPFVQVPPEVAKAKGKEHHQGGLWAHVLCVLRQPGLWIDWRAQHPMLMHKPASSPDRETTKTFGIPTTWGGGTARGWEGVANLPRAQLACDMCKRPGGGTVQCCVGLEPVTSAHGSHGHGHGSHGSAAGAVAGVPWETPALAAPSRFTKAKDWPAALGKDHGLSTYGVPVQMSYYSCRDKGAHGAICGSCPEPYECHFTMHASCGRMAGVYDDFSYDDLRRAPIGGAGAGASSSSAAAGRPAQAVVLPRLKSRTLCDAHSRRCTLMLLFRESVDRNRRDGAKAAAAGAGGKAGASAGLTISLSDNHRAFLKDRRQPVADKPPVFLKENKWWYKLIGVPSEELTDEITISGWASPKSGTGTGGAGAAAGSAAGAGQSGRKKRPDGLEELEPRSASEGDAYAQAVQSIKNCKDATLRLQKRGVLPLSLDVGRWLPVTVVVALKKLTEQGVADPLAALDDAQKKIYRAWLTKASKAVNGIVQAAYALDAFDLAVDKDMEKYITGKANAAVAAAGLAGSGAGAGAAGSSAGAGSAASEGIAIDDDEDGEGAAGPVVKRARLSSGAAGASASGAEAASASAGSSGSGAAAAGASGGGSAPGRVTLKDIPSMPAYTGDAFTTMPGDIIDIDKAFHVAHRFAVQGDMDKAVEQRAVAENLLDTYTSHLHSIIKAWGSRIAGLRLKARQAGVPTLFPGPHYAFNVQALAPVMRAGLLTGLGWDWPGNTAIPVLPPLVEERVQRAATDLAVACLGNADKFGALSTAPAWVTSWAAVAGTSGAAASLSAGLVSPGSAALPTARISPICLLLPFHTSESAPARILRQTAWKASSEAAMADLLLPGARAPASINAAALAAKMADPGSGSSSAAAKDTEDSASAAYEALVSGLPVDYGKPSGSSPVLRVRDLLSMVAEGVRGGSGETNGSGSGAGSSAGASSSASGSSLTTSSGSAIVDHYVTSLMKRAGVTTTAGAVAGSAAATS